MSNLFLPSSMTGYARNQAESQYPEYWEGLVGYWDFSLQGAIPALGRALDFSGNGNHGTLVADTHSVPGKFGNVLNFDGTGDYVVTNNITKGVTEFTYYIWLRPGFASNTGSERFGVITWQGTEGNNDRLRLMWVTSGTGFYMDSKVNFAYTADPAFSANEWHCIAFTRGAEDTGQFYWDGVPFSTTTLVDNGGINDVSGMPIRIGWDFGDLGVEYWLGQIGNVLIYNRALSAGKLAFLYHHPKALVTPRHRTIVIVPAAVLLSINVNDLVSVADAVDALVPLLGPVSVNDGVSVTDAVGVLIPTVGPVNVNDAVSVTDAAELLIPTAGPVNVNDAISVTDAVAIELSLYEVNVNEAVAVTDAVDLLVPTVGPVAVNDSVSVTDTANLALDVYEINVNDAVGVTDGVSAGIGLTTISVNDAVSVTDEATLALDLYEINVNDAVSVTDAVEVSLSVYEISVSDAVSVTDAVGVELATYEVNVNDAVSVTDSISAALDSYTVAVYDSVSVADAGAISVTPLLLAASDAVSVSDSVDVSMASIANVAAAFMIMRQCVD